MAKQWLTHSQEMEEKKSPLEESHNVYRREKFVGIFVIHHILGSRTNEM